jgi:hypothetical protein
MTTLAGDAEGFIERMRAHGHHCIALTRAQADAEIAREEARAAQRPRMTPEQRAAYCRRERELLRAVFAALRPALQARIPSARIVFGWSPTGRPPPWQAVPIEPGELPIVFRPLPPPFVGFAAVVVRVEDVPAPQLDAAAKDRIALALADALLAQEGL